MTKVAVKRLRVSQAEVELLARLAKEQDRTESEILREGLRLVERVHRRKRVVDDLRDLCHIDESSYVKWEGRV